MAQPAKKVDLAFLKIIQRQLNEAMHYGSLSINGPNWEKLEAVAQKVHILIRISPDVEPENTPGITKDDLAQLAGLKTYDPSLPQGWVDMVRNQLNFNVAPHFVYGYDDNKMGRPVPVTSIGKAMLPVINHVMGTCYPGK